MEIKILQDIDHPNCCKLIEVMESRKKIYIIQELMEGPTLYDRFLLNKGDMCEWHIARCIHQIALALQYLHDRQIVHRDLKPANIMFADANGDMSSLKILDFGFAVYLKPGGMTYSSRGTPNYMAPETIFRDSRRGTVAYGHSCDMWSLGVILYEMLAGRSPFSFGVIKTKADLPDFFRKVVECPIVFAPIEWKNTSPEAKDLVLKLLEKDASKRLTARRVLRHPWITKSKTRKKESLPEDDFNRMYLASSFRQTRIRKMIACKKFIRIALYLTIMARMRWVMNTFLELVDLEAEKSLGQFCVESMNLMEVEDEKGASRLKVGAEQPLCHSMSDRKKAQISRIERTCSRPKSRCNEHRTKRLSLAALHNVDLRMNWERKLPLHGINGIMPLKLKPMTELCKSD
eukprot:CAMPEP_0184503466 /NCGR_PEP_ID=MMETSP0113_2-20130426/51906_1 /TAXON_ID=91329 /ORGANISM="Norrisiella sphaerica, Strain BC52" /LENGTH=402 /DNA_ID=CAMNT_0026892963 /DNA_START=436 /DNA_END=1644 /DNA_ORIENTATION=+